MKKITIIIILAFFYLNIYADNFDDALIKANQELREAQEKNSGLTIAIEKERKNLISKKNDLLKSIEFCNNEKIKLKNDFDKYNISLFEQRQILSSVNSEYSSFLDSAQDAVNELYADIKNLNFASEMRTQYLTLHNYAFFNIIPDKDMILSFFSIMFDAIKFSGKIRVYDGKFYNLKGREESAKIIAFGQNCLYFHSKHDKHRAGILSFNPAAGYICEQPIKLSFSSKRAIIKTIEIFEKKTTAEFSYLPIDVTGGKVFEKLKTEKDILEHIKSGGLIVYPILLLALAAIFIIVERYIFLTKNFKAILNNKNLYTDVLNNNSQSEKNNKFIPEIYRSVIKTANANKNLPADEFQKKIEETISVELPALERRLSALQVIAAVAPLLGLLGTVTGIISTFDAITAFGFSEPRLLSSGISEALVTTELGLMTAIPAYLAYSFLSAKVDSALTLLQSIVYNCDN